MNQLGVQFSDVPVNTRFAGINEDGGVTLFTTIPTKTNGCWRVRISDGTGIYCGRLDTHDGKAVLLRLKKSDVFLLAKIDIIRQMKELIESANDDQQVSLNQIIQDFLEI